SVIGALAVRRVDAAWLDVLVGGSVLLAIAATFVLRRHRAGVDGPFKGVAVGLAAGFMNTTCGVAAPALTAYALATGWEHRRFAATLQPVLITANLTSLVTKAVVRAGPPPGFLPWWIWPVAATGVCLGVALGSLLARVVSMRVAAGITVAVASAGAAAALVRGLLTV
ncbi:MAG: TSUP family transporter, partial [Sporichthyaceae bacterium]|nr:TSUP family transporter [Sporichthyaceae bacterium]